MITFTLKEYGTEGDVLLVRKEKREPAVKGLPPEHSSVIFMKQNEINELIEVLTEYAKQR